MLYKKSGIIFMSIVVFLFQISTVCVSMVSRDVVADAGNLRRIIETRPLQEVRQFLSSYLEQAPELLPDVFWDTKSWSHYGQSDSYLRVLLYNIACRNDVQFDDHATVLSLLVDSLHEAYQRKGFACEVANQKTVEWLLEGSTQKSRFLEYCVYGYKKNGNGGSKICSKKIRRKIIDMTIEILNRRADIAVKDVILRAPVESGFPLSAHIADL